MFCPDSRGLTEHKHHLRAGGETFALHTQREGNLNGKPAKAVSYFHHDHLGSLAVISNAAGTVVERLAYDPWGKRRQTNGLSDSTDTLTSANTKRGYTMHEHMDEMGVINMNGRVYDPAIGRFLTADPFIQARYFLQSFNRFAYVWNNPLKMWDPSGYGAYHDSVSGAGYGSSNGAHDRKGVGGVSDGRGGQVGGNSGNPANASGVAVDDDVVVAINWKKKAADLAMEAALAVAEIFSDLEADRRPKPPKNPPTEQTVPGGAKPDPKPDPNPDPNPGRKPGRKSGSAGELSMPIHAGGDMIGGSINTINFDASLMQGLPYQDPLSTRMDIFHR